MMSMSSEVTCVDGGEGEIEKDSERDRHGEKTKRIQKIEKKETYRERKREQPPPPQKKNKTENGKGGSISHRTCAIASQKWKHRLQFFTVVAIATVFVAVLAFICL